MRRTTRGNSRLRQQHQQALQHQLGQSLALNSDDAAGAAPLFNGLTSEKTFLEDPSPVSDALERLCPRFDATEAGAHYQEARRYLDRICQEIYFKLHVNNYRINYDTPVVTSTTEDLVWGEEERYEILLPLRLPPGFPLRIHPEGGAGLIGIRIPVMKQKQPAMLEKDPFDFLKSPKRYVSSAVTLKSTWKLVNNAIQQISVRYGRDLTVQQVEINKEAGSIDVTLTVSSGYLETQLAPPPEQGQSNGTVADDDQHPVSFAIHMDEVTSQGEAEERLPEGEDEAEEAFDEKLSDAPATVLYIRGGRRRGKAAPEPTSRVLRLRLMPVIRHHSDEHAFLSPRPYSFASRANVNPDLWTVQYSTEEALLLQSLARADRGLRLRSWRGLTDFCAAQPELRCVTRDMLKHATFHLAETEIDLVGIRWQRANLAHYTSDLLASVRDHMHTGSLPHFFYKDVNLLQCLQPHQRRSAALKIDFFLRKDTALIRAAQRTIACRTAV